MPRSVFSPIPVATLGLILLFARPSFAETSALDSKASLAKYREAYRAIDRKEWREARAILLELWPKTRTYDVAASLGQVEYQLKNYASAARYISFAIAHVAPKERAENLERYTKALDEVRKHIASVRVSVNEPEAQILVNDERIGVAPLQPEIFLNPGSYVIAARTQERGVSRQVNVESGRTYLFELVLPAGVAASRAPVVEEPLAASKPLEPTVSPVRPTRFEPEKTRVPLWIGAGVTTVGIAGAVGFGIAARDAEDDARALRNRLSPNGCSNGTEPPMACQAAANAVDRQQTNATLSTVSVGVAAAGALSMIGYWLFWPEPETRSAIRIEPVFGALRSHAGVALQGGF